MSKFDNDIKRKYLFEGVKNQEDREKLLNIDDKLHKQNEIIKSALYTVNDIENDANDIICELQKNKEKINSIHEKVYESENMTDTARRLLNSMNSREIQQKWIFIFISVLIIFAICISIWFSLKK